MNLQSASRRDGATPLAPSHAKTPYDNMPAPGGRRLGDLKPVELARLGEKLGIAGISHANGHATNAEAFADHVAAIRREAADRAEQAWLAANATVAS